MKNIVSVPFVCCVLSSFCPTPCAILPSLLLIEWVQSTDVNGSEISSFHSISLPVTGWVIEKANTCMMLSSLNAIFDFYFVLQRIAERAGLNAAVKNIGLYLMIKVVCLCVSSCYNSNSSTTSNTLNFLWTPSAQQARRLFVWIFVHNYSHCDLNIQDRY